MSKVETYLRELQSKIEEAFDTDSSINIPHVNSDGEVRGANSANPYSIVGLVNYLIYLSELEEVLEDEH